MYVWLSRSDIPHVYIFVGNIKEEVANEVRSAPVVESGVGSM